MSSFSNFTLLFKKMARKSSIGRKITTRRQKRTKTRLHTPNTTTTTHTTLQDPDIASVSTCSTNELDTGDINLPSTTSTKLTSDSKIEHLVTAVIPLSTPESTQDKVKTESNRGNRVVNDSASIRSHSDHQTILIRDFAYPESLPLHFGKTPSVNPYNESDISISSCRFNGRHAKALYDFIPETKDEVAMKCGQVIWIQDRQCTGWLIADVEDETGLVPESYIEFV